jgi:hypothetical protein
MASFEPVEKGLLLWGEALAQLGKTKMNSKKNVKPLRKVIYLHKCI